MRFLRKDVWRPWPAWGLRSWVEYLNQQISKHSFSSWPQIFQAPFWQHFIVKMWIFRNISVNLQVLLLRSDCCHFRWRLQLTRPVTENRSRNQLTHCGEEGAWQESCWRPVPQSAEASYICWKRQKTLSFYRYAWRRHRNHPFRWLYWFFTQRQKSPEYTSVDFCRRSQVRTTQLPK